MIKIKEIIKRSGELMAGNSNLHMPKSRKTSEYVGFLDNQKCEAYERQNGIFPTCNKHFKYEQMKNDHITS